MEKMTSEDLRVAGSPLLQTKALKAICFSSAHLVVLSVYNAQSEHAI